MYKLNDIIEYNNNIYRVMRHIKEKSYFVKMLNNIDDDDDEVIEIVIEWVRA